jgi:SUN domain-containing protein 1/2
VEVIDTSLPSVQEEVEEYELQAGPSRMEQRARSAYSFGGLLGKVVNLVIRVILLTISRVGHAAGRAVAVSYDLFFQRPAKFIGTANLAPFFTLLLISAVCFGLFTALRNSSLPPFFGGGSAPVYQAPDVPASNIAEISARLQALENALAGLSLDTQQSKVKIDSHARVQHDVTGRLDALQSQLQKDSSRTADDRQLDRTSASQSLAAVRSEVESLRTMVSQVVATPSKGDTKSEEDKKAEDAVARARLETLEERVGSVEGGVREALELGKSVVRVPGEGSNSAAPPWWSKITRSGKPLTIKADGQDVTDVIGHLVDTAVARRDLDGIAKADFALFSGGGRIWPKQTSRTIELGPKGAWDKLTAWLFADGERIGRPPAVALHHDNANGRCWAFNGDRGQLGVILARPAFIEEVTIDHVAQQLTWDVRSAPRQMELWGFVEHKENEERVAAWEEARARQRVEDGAANEEDEYVEYWGDDKLKFVRVARFEYDAHAGVPVQTFTADPAVRALGVDFSQVVLRIHSNWGRDDYTCLYRLRVHGEMLAPNLPPSEALADA